jgi:prophage regulatory protein
MTVPPGDRFISIRDVCQLTSLSRTTIWRMGRSNAFPREVRLSAGRVAWLESDVRRWMEARHATSGGRQ